MPSCLEGPFYNSLSSLDQHLNLQFYQELYLVIRQDVANRVLLECNLTIFISPVVVAGMIRLGWNLEEREDHGLSPLRDRISMLKALRYVVYCRLE